MNKEKAAAESFVDGPGADLKHYPEEERFNHAQQMVDDFVRGLRFIPPFKGTRLDADAVFDHVVAMMKL